MIYLKMYVAQVFKDIHSKIIAAMEDTKVLKRTVLAVAEAKYAMEDLAKMSEEDKLAQLGWTKVDPGFGSQQIFKTNGML